MRPHPLPPEEGFVRFKLLELSERGLFRDGSREVPGPETHHFLDRQIYLAPEVTDVFIWVHGWRNGRNQALTSARRLFAGIEAVYSMQPQRYGGLSEFRPAFIAVHWPSKSLPFLGGYRKIRERAHRMTEDGAAEFVLASLLGYLEESQPPEAHQRRGPGVLRAQRGYYVHCVGHSFGGRFLCQAVAAAAEPSAPTLALLPPNQRFQFTVDTLLVFQMAAPADIFSGRLAPLLRDAPLQGPICLTFSAHDRAVCRWHRVAEGVTGIGCGGAREPSDQIQNASLRPVDEDYLPAELTSHIVNLDATWAYEKSPWYALQGAHSDIWYEESLHLLLTLASYAR